MQNKARGAVLALMMAGLVVAPIAEAKRAGGGKSSGMSRTQTSSQSYQQQNNMNRTTPAPTPAAQPQKSGSNVGGMVAAGVAGAAIGAVAMNAMADDDTAANPNAVNAADAENTQAVAPEEEKGGMGWLWILILAAIAFFVFRKFKAKKSNATNPFAPGESGVGRQTTQAPFGQPSTPTNSNTNIFGQPVGGGASSAPVGGFGGAYTNSGNQLPDGTEPATFLRFARQRFNHIQAMNTASNIEEIRRYFTPDMYQAIYQDIASNNDVAEFSNLLANVVEQTTENGQYIVSVRFTGMVSEDINSPTQSFSETWHFVKPQGSQEEWVVAGIQQN